MTTFNPEKIPTAEYPHPVGAVLLGTGGLSTVIDRDGTAFLACCQAHEDAGKAFGYYPQRDNGRLLGFGHERTDFKPGGYQCPSQHDLGDGEDEACGEGMCQCSCGQGHPCGCDCPRCPECQQKEHNCDCDDD